MVALPSLTRHRYYTQTVCSAGFYQPNPGQTGCLGSSTTPYCPCLVCPPEYLTHTRRSRDPAGCPGGTFSGQGAGGCTGMLFSM
jgi:hypothetical protein